MNKSRELSLSRKQYFTRIPKNNFYKKNAVRRDKINEVEREEAIRKNMERAQTEQEEINRNNLRLRLKRATNRTKTPQKNTNMFASTSFSNPVSEHSQKEKNKKVYNQSLENLKSYL